MGSENFSVSCINEIKAVPLHAKKQCILFPCCAENEPNSDLKNKVLSQFSIPLHP